MNLQEGLYVRTTNGRIAKIESIIGDYIFLDINHNIHDKNKIKSVSKDLMDLVEYMDLLEIENPIKVYGKDEKISLFNPVRCDGFTVFEDGTRCIILNLDYLVDIKDLKIKSILTSEQFYIEKYKVGE